MTTFATYDLSTNDLDRAAAVYARPYRTTGDDSDLTRLWYDSQARSAAVLATADPADVRLLVELASVR